MENGKDVVDLSVRVTVHDFAMSYYSVHIGSVAAARAPRYMSG
jgi:hypothetical protein